MLEGDTSLFIHGELKQGMQLLEILLMARSEVRPSTAILQSPSPMSFPQHFPPFNCSVTGPHVEHKQPLRSHNVEEEEENNLPL